MAEAHALAHVLAQIAFDLRPARDGIVDTRIAADAAWHIHAHQPEMPDRMIEHLDRREAQAFLLEVQRILRPGGIVRIAAPDLARFAEDYSTTGDADEFIASTHMGLARPVGMLSRAKWALIGPRHHLWMYDGLSLSKLVSDAGFVDVMIMPAGKTNISDPGSLDLEERANESVYVEAAQPE